MQVLVEAASFTESASDFREVGQMRKTHTEVVCLQDQKNDPGDFAQKLDQLSFVSKGILHFKAFTGESPPATCLPP